MPSRGRPRSLAMLTRDLIWRMYANAGMGIREIARELNKLGVRTATGKGPWYPGSVQNVISAAKRDLTG